MKQWENNPYLEQKYQENEVRANRVVAVMLLVFATLPISNEITLLLDYVEGMKLINRYVFIPLGVAILIVFGIAWKNKFRGNWVRIMLMTGLFLSVGICFLLFTTYVSFLIFLPVFVSMVYLNLKYTQKILVISMVIFLFDCVVNVIMEQYSPLFQQQHYNTTYNLWAHWLDTLMYVVMPLAVTAIYVTVFIVNSVKNSREIMENQVKYQQEAANLSSALAMAAEIQKNTLPAEEYTTSNGGFSISCTEVPAKEVGGDFYDYFMIGDKYLVFMIADVSDKGLPAAMFMMAAKKAIHCALRCEHSLEKVVELANRLICEDANGMFLTLWLGIIDVTSGMGKFANAGHLPPIMKKRNGEIEILENEPDLFIGPFPDRSPKEHTIRMEEGDLLFLYTDGLTDTMNSQSESYGRERLMQAIAKGGTDAYALRTNVLSSVNAFSGDTEKFDDLTILALECKKLESVEKLELSFLSGSEGTEKAMGQINDLLKRVGCPEESRRNADVILDEVLTNIHEYAYEGVESEIRMRVSAGGSFVSLRFFDTGAPFNPLEEKDPELDGEPQIGGLGIWLYRNLADKVQYRYKDGKNELAIRLIWDI